MGFTGLGFKGFRRLIPGSKDPNNMAAGPKYYNINGIWARTPHYFGPWTLGGWVLGFRVLGF